MRLHFVTPLAVILERFEISGFSSFMVGRTPGRRSV